MPILRAYAHAGHENAQNALNAASRIEANKKGNRWGGWVVRKTVKRLSQNGHAAMLKSLTIIPPSQPDS